MKVAILGAAHQHVDYALTEVGQRDELELVAASEPDPQLRERFLAGISAPLYDTPHQLLDVHDVDVALRRRGLQRTRRGRHRGAASRSTCAGRQAAVHLPRAAGIDPRGRRGVGQARLDRVREAFLPGHARVAAPAGRRGARQHRDGRLDRSAQARSAHPSQPGSWTPPPMAESPETCPSMTSTWSWTWSEGEQGAIPCGTVSAHIGNARADDHPRFDDHVALLLRAGEVPATIEANWLGPEAANVHGHYRMRVTGTLGTAEIDWAYHRLTVTTHDRETWEEPLGPARRPRSVLLRCVERGGAAGDHDRCEPAGHRGCAQGAAQR